MAEKHYVQTRDGQVIEVPKSEVRSKLESGEFLPATAADKAEADKAEKNSTFGAKAKTFAESAAASAIDAAQAPIAAPVRLGAAALGYDDPLANVSGRKTVENLASLYGDARETLDAHRLAPGESGGQTGESYGRQYAGNARDRAIENPLTATAGNLVGAVAAGGAMSGGLGAVGEGVAEGLGGGALARGAGSLTKGALEGAAYGQAAASEEAYLHNIPLTGEKVLASMGLGAILGGTVSLGAEGLGAIVRRGSRATSVADDAIEGAEGLETPKSQFSDSLREFADERTAKALGARASDLKKLGRTAEQAQKELRSMSRTVREAELEDGSKVFSPFDSQEDLAANVQQAKSEAGARLGKFRERADEVFEKHPEIAPRPAEIAERIRKEIADPLSNHPLSAARAQAAPIEQVAKDLEALGARSANDNARGVGISDLTQLRMGLDDQIYQAKRGVNLTQQGAPPNLKDLEKARGILEESIEASTDKAAQYFDTAAEKSYKQLKAQWRQLHLASEISGAASLQNLGNRVVSPSDYIAGAGALAHGFGGIQSALVAAGHHVVREHASSVLAVLADKLANTLDGKIESGLASYLKEATSRAKVGAIADRAGKIASAVPIRRAAVPAAVTAFVGKSGDIQKAYQTRTDDLLAANREGGSGVRGAVAKAMAGGYDALPKTSQALTVAATRGTQYLASQMPGGTRSPTVFSPSRRTSPSDLQIREFAQKWAAVSNPLSVIDDLRRGTVTHAQVDAVKNVYPELYQQIQQSALEKIRALDEQGRQMPFQDRLQLDLFLDLGGAGEPTLAGKFVDRVAGLLAAKQRQQEHAAPKSGAALAKLSASATPGSAALGEAS